MPDHAGAEDALQALREHVQGAHQAAARLAHEHREAAPPSGWDAPQSAPDTGGELRALVALLESLHDVLPEDLREQLNELVRQILLLARAVIDWLVTQLDAPPAPPGPPAEVQDIPIA